MKTILGTDLSVQHYDYDYPTGTFYRLRRRGLCITYSTPERCRYLWPRDKYGPSLRRRIGLLTITTMRRSVFSSAAPDPR